MGSRLVASLAIHADGIDSARAVQVANGRREDSATEPWRTILSRSAHLQLLADSGWLTIQETDIPSAGGRGCDPAGRRPSRDLGHEETPMTLVTMELDDYLWYVDRAIDSMCSIARQLGDELVNERPDLSGANSAYALVTHCCGVMADWGGYAIAGHPVERDRAGRVRGDRDRGRSAGNRCGGS